MVRIRPRTLRIQRLRLVDPSGVVWVVNEFLESGLESKEQQRLDDNCCSNNNPLDGSLDELKGFPSLASRYFLILSKRIVKRFVETPRLLSLKAQELGFLSKV
ncbi:hypothetical protein HAX54_037727 [Datura stramonium]|uniref:Uncharacterized protein n=1 Tax=Datura stramonium TaxID=4076 RepID=A0ABS8SIA0_DATST|nr:hypothetical protein [Datura stramonium]